MITYARLHDTRYCRSTYLPHSSSHFLFIGYSKEDLASLFRKWISRDINFCLLVLKARPLCKVSKDKSAHLICSYHHLVISLRSHAKTLQEKLAGLYCIFFLCQHISNQACVQSRCLCVVCTRQTNRPVIKDQRQGMRKTNISRLVFLNI